jgi:DNA-binding NarL/FixJ family response regulator
VNSNGNRVLPPTAVEEGALGPRLLIVVHPRQLLLGCLSFWLRALGPDFDVVGVADVEALTPVEKLARACAVVIGASGSIRSNVWLRKQADILRAKRPDVPVVVIGEEDEAREAEAELIAMNLHGYIPTSSTMEVAAAALNLVAVGGRYVPRLWEMDRQPPRDFLERSGPDARAASAGRLTRRERAVLDLLEQGMPNKMIAHRLNISQSTVKAHVHNIISKLEVHNRTGAAVAARRMQPTTLRTNDNGMDAGLPNVIEAERLVSPDPLVNP